MKLGPRLLRRGMPVHLCCAFLLARRDHKGMGFLPKTAFRNFETVCVQFVQRGANLKK